VPRATDTSHKPQCVVPGPLSYVQCVHAHAGMVAPSAAPAVGAAAEIGGCEAAIGSGSGAYRFLLLIIQLTNKNIYIIYFEK